MTVQNLTIRFTPDGFSFNDGDHRDIAPGADFMQQLQEAVLDQIEPGQHDPLKCELETTRVMLLPPDIQDQELVRQMFDVTFSRPTRPEEVLTQHVVLPKSDVEVTLCFAIDRELYHFLLRNYCEPEFCHPLATMLADADRMTQGNCLVVRCDRRFLEVALFRGKELSLCNCYHTAQADTRSYYVMNTWLQQGLDQLQDYLLVLGQGNEGLQVRASLHRFIKHVFS